jgi:hypothetical protein
MRMNLLFMRSNPPKQVRRGEINRGREYGERHKHNPYPAVAWTGLSSKLLTMRIRNEAICVEQKIHVSKGERPRKGPLPGGNLIGASHGVGETTRDHLCWLTQEFPNIFL